MLPRIQREIQARVARYPHKVLAPDTQVGRHHQHLSGLCQVVGGGVVRHRGGGGLDVELVVEAVQPKAPGQGVGGDSRLKKVHALGPHGDGRSAAGIGRQGRQLLHIGFPGHQVPLGPGRRMDQQVPVLARAELLPLRQNKTIGTHTGRSIVVRAG